MRAACFFPLRLSGQPFLSALLVSLLLPACRPLAEGAADVNVRGFALNQPIAVYNNWSAYDELSDRVELTEALAMKQFDELLRLPRAGVRFDYYLMDAFWYSRAGGDREFRRPHWPNGPERWLAACCQHRVKPGLWLASNQLSALEPAPEWESSLNESRTAMCLFAGGLRLPLTVTSQQENHRWTQMDTDSGGKEAFARPIRLTQQ